MQINHGYLEERRRGKAERVVLERRWTMKGAKIFLVLALGIFLVVPAYSDGAIKDPAPVNIQSVDAFYDYRDYGTWSRTHDGGSEGRSGAYFQISIGVVLGNILLNFEDVIEVKAEHLGTGQMFYLMRDPCTKWIDTDIQYWYLLVRPENWMFGGRWKFKMLYDGSDGKRHYQIAKKKMGPQPFPMKPSHIKIVKEDSSFILSWSAIGDPNTGHFGYRVRIYDDGCVVGEVRGDWEGGVGSYDAELNKVIFPVAPEWSRHRVRLENRIYTPNQWGRACQYLQLPE